MRYSYIYLLIGVFCSSCIFTVDPKATVDKRMTINNNSKEDIYFFISDIDSLNRKQGILPYEIFKKTDIDGKEIRDTIYSNVIRAGEVEIILNHERWDNRSQSLDEKFLTIYFFDKQTLENYSWHEIVNEQIYVSKKNYSINELNKNNWLIEFP